MHDLTIELSDRELIVRGERRPTYQEELRCRHQENYWGPFYRSVNLACEVNPDNVAATLKDGVLRIKLSKTNRAKRISVIQY